jgi:hypothetical protein
LVPPPVIVCVDCGGRAHLLTTWDDEDPPVPGDLAVYRCEDCLDRWDLILEADDEVDRGDTTRHTPPNRRQ